MMAAASLISLGLALIFVLVPDLNKVFDLSEKLPYYSWLLTLGTAIFITICDELLKAWIRHRMSGHARTSLQANNLSQCELRASTHTEALVAPPPGNRHGTVERLPV
jgi:hypothetical protein